MRQVGIGQKEMANKIGYEWHKMKNIETEKYKLTPEIAKIFEQNYSISGWWLLTGTGKMFIEDKTPPSNDNINLNLSDYNHFN